MSHRLANDIDVLCGSLPQASQVFGGVEATLALLRQKDHADPLCRSRMAMLSLQ